jgi:hypothetical protein
MERIHFECREGDKMARVVIVGDPMQVAFDILMQTFNSVTGTWQAVRHFNSVSDDYALTNAREAAREAVSGHRPAPRRHRTFRTISRKKRPV